MKQLYVITIVFFISSCSSLYAQKWEVGITGGAMSYTGDLNQNEFYDFNHLAAGGLLKVNLNSYWAVKFGLLAGKVSAADADSRYEEQQNRNLSFFSPLTEGSLQVELNFFDYGINFGQKRFTPFVFTGISVFSFNPKTELDGDTYQLKYFATEQDVSDGSEAYSTIALAVPLGLGVKYRLSENLNLIGEFGFRTTQTDYLDDVSQRYPNISGMSDDDLIRQQLSDPSLTSPKIGQPGVQRGDFRKKDTYLFAGITLSYTFVRQICPF